MIEIDHTHDGEASSWVEGADGHRDFPVQNLPLGIFSTGGGQPRIGTAIGDHVLDVTALTARAELPDTVADSLSQPSLNALCALPASDRSNLRRTIFALLTNPNERDRVGPTLHPAAACRMHLPFEIGDYTDFYVGIHHATNIGRLFRPDTPLLPNYKHVPIGYHGRASSVRPSGVPVVRPNGQRRGADGEPLFGPSTRLDYELELGIWIGPGNDLGQPIPIDAAADHITGFCLLNDWSARDLQTWEYQPLGPFLAKSFHTTISPWVVTPEALAPFRLPQPIRPTGDPRPLPYLWSDADQTCGALGLTLEVYLATARMRAERAEPYRLSHGEASAMYWTSAQIVTHHASNGCNLRPGDLLGTGTISGPTRDSYGSLIELTSGGADAISLPTGETRTFLEDGDEIILRASAARDGFAPIGFGSCRAVVQPAPALSASSR